MSELTIGFLLGVLFSSFICFMQAYSEWRRRRELQKDVDNLMRNLACGQKYVGCSGGPRCASDHK